MGQKFVTDSAIGFNGGKFNQNSIVELELEKEAPIKDSGALVTTAAFRQMIKQKLSLLQDELRKDPELTEAMITEKLNNKICSVDFGKGTLLRLLSQSRCMGLRFTFCVNHENQDSIIVSGIEFINGSIDPNTGRVVGAKAIVLNYENYSLENASGSKTMDDEKGVGRNYADFFNEIQLPFSDFITKQDPTDEKLTDGVLGLL